MAEIDEPLQTFWFATSFTVGVGFTVMVNDCIAPVQPLTVGVTMIVAVIGIFPEFRAVKIGISPVPFAAKPIEGVSFTHAKFVPAIFPEIETKGFETLLHKTILDNGLAVGTGFTVMLNVLETPSHPPVVGVTVKVATMGVKPELMAINAEISPVPLAAKPMPGTLFVQL